MVLSWLRKKACLTLYTCEFISLFPFGNEGRRTGEDNVLRALKKKDGTLSFISSIFFKW